MCFLAFKHRGCVAVCIECRLKKLSPHFTHDGTDRPSGLACLARDKERIAACHVARCKYNIEYVSRSCHMTRCTDRIEHAALPFGAQRD